MIELDIAINHKCYAGSNTSVLADIDFQVQRGEFVAIIGPSGCGKTTLLNMIGGLETCSEQKISYGGCESDNSNGGKKQTTHQLGYIFQQPRLMPWLTVRENIELVLPSHQHQQIENLLTQVGLANKGEYFPRQLSGGMQRRVSIARAFAINPSLLLLDEPFNSLDAPTATKLRHLLVDLWQQRETTVIFVTHNLQEAIYLADRIIFLSDAPSSIIHQSVVDLPRPRKEYGVAELEWHAQLMTQFPHLLAGRLDSFTG